NVNCELIFLIPKINREGRNTKTYLFFRFVLIRQAFFNLPGGGARFVGGAAIKKEKNRVGGGVGLRRKTLAVGGGFFPRLSRVVEPQRTLINGPRPAGHCL
ncbi:hypothetical protein, partial [Enterobacter hormaechei]|uniref:hypothetical protein n=1 Tax=Enterobacter hormaechei TaxID=158836 RepID=UPI001CE1FA8C